MEEEIFTHIPIIMIQLPLNLLGYITEMGNRQGEYLISYYVYGDE
jgi:hypothetical protein